MKLYYAPGVCSLAPHIVAHEAGLNIGLIKTDIRAKTTESGADFNATNPLGYVPALELDDGSIMTEGPAIMQLLSDKAPASHLAPPNGTPERYKMQSWLNFISTELHKGFTPLLSPAIAGKLNEQSKAVFMERLMSRFAVLDTHLAKHDYLMGRQFTCADAYCYTVSRWAPRLHIDIPAKFPHLAAFMTRCEARPGVQAALKAEGLTG
jgi:glutathione S-transferase